MNNLSPNFIPYTMASNLKPVSNRRSSHQSYVCDQCYRCKVKCNREQPSCHRCQENNRSCTYSLGMWKGQPKSSHRKRQEKEAVSQQQQQQQQQEQEPRTYRAVGQEGEIWNSALCCKHLLTKMIDETSSEVSVLSSTSPHLEAEQDKIFDSFFNDTEDSTVMLGEFLHTPSTEEIIEFNPSFINWEDNARLETSEDVQLLESRTDSTFTAKGALFEPSGVLSGTCSMNEDILPFREIPPLERSNLSNATTKQRNRTNTLPHSAEETRNSPGSAHNSLISRSSEVYHHGNVKNACNPNIKLQSRNNESTEDGIQSQGTNTTNKLLRRHSHRESQRVHPYMRHHNYSRSANSIKSLDYEQWRPPFLTPVSTPDHRKTSVISLQSDNSTPTTPYPTPSSITQESPTEIQSTTSINIQSRNKSCTCLSTTIHSLESIQLFSSKPISKDESFYLVQSTLSTCEQSIRCPCRGSCWAALRCLFIMQEVYQLLQLLQGTQNHSSSIIGASRNSTCAPISEECVYDQAFEHVDDQASEQKEQVQRQVMRAVMILAGLEMILLSLSSRQPVGLGSSLNLKTILADLLKGFRALLDIGEA
jgi:hypothetical protein